MSQFGGLMVLVWYTFGVIEAWLEQGSMAIA